PPAGPHHPGRTAPDLGAARHARRTVRDGGGQALHLGGRRQEGPAQGGRLDGDDPAGRRSGPRRLPAAGGGRPRPRRGRERTTPSTGSGPRARPTPDGSTSASVRPVGG